MKKINRILHITPTDIRYDGRILKELDTLKVLSNCEIQAFGIEDNEGQNYLNEIHNIRIFSIKSKKYRFLPRPIRYFCVLLEGFMKILIPALKFKPTIIHCHDTLFLPIAIVIKLYWNSRLIYDAHELESAKGGQSRILSKFTLIIEKICWKRIDLLISVSSSILNWYSFNIGKKKNLLIMNSPVINKKIDKGKNENYLRQKFNIPSDKKVFIYIGLMNLGRGIDNILDVFLSEKITSHLVFLGYGDFVEKIKAVEAMNPKIHFHNAVPHDEIVDIAKTADVGLCLLEPVSLSDYYCLPNKLFEYALSDIYILAADFPDIRDVVYKYNLGLCSSLDFDSLTNVVNSIEIEGVEKIKKDLYQLSWERQAEKLVSAYKELIEM
jgi:glycosyltransferase involved in cell wall biosynthesis